MLLSLATFPHATVQAKKQNTIEHICEQTTKQRSCCLQLNMWLASHSHSDIPWRVVSFVSLQQIMWQRLFQGTSSAESGTIFLIFQRNIHKDVAKHMNATEDLFETTFNYYIIAAAMHFLQCDRHMIHHKQMLFLKTLSTGQYLNTQNVCGTKLHNLLTDMSFCQICPKTNQKSKTKHKEFLKFATSRKQPREHM